jgi:hypothetical protein
MSNGAMSYVRCLMDVSKRIKLFIWPVGYVTSASDIVSILDET